MGVSSQLAVVDATIRDGVIREFLQLVGFPAPAKMSFERREGVLALSKHPKDLPDRTVWSKCPFLSS